MGSATEAASPLEGFIRRWEKSGAAERANYALFLSELCDVLGVPRPEPTGPDDAQNAYVFERNVPFRNPDGTTTVKRIDLYRRGRFVLEAKQGSDRAATPAVPALALPTARPKKRGTAVRGTAGWDAAMVEAKGQAEQYVRHLPAGEPNPPFLVVVDVGHSLELHADFTTQGRTYVPFPDALTHRIKLRDLARDDVRARLKMVWDDPLALDPSRRAAKVTREVAARLASLAQSLERSGHAADAVAQFLMRCLFTLFAEDAGLLPRAGFTDMLRGLRDRGESSLFPDMARSLWETMRTGGFSAVLRARLLRFNGGLFEGAEALPLTDDQIALLIDAGEKDWRDVEPAIFGTLLERALSPVERHRLGAHYTPRAYVERLVMPTIIEPLRDEWANALAAAVTLANETKLPEARDEVRAFLTKLCNTTVLDPACGTGNFLYVTLEHMKRLEGEVLDALRGFGETQAAFEGFGLTVDPHQLLGIEINPRAAAIADLVLWIGYLQWHFRTYGNRMPAEPVIHAYHNIECRDAILDYDGTESLRSSRGEILTRWDGRTMKRHPVSGEDIPDEASRIASMKYMNARKAEWPRSDYIIGNPPFIGSKRMRDDLGDAYVDAVQTAWPEVPQATDFVLRWWHAAAQSIRSGETKRFGFITTNSISQAYNRRVIEPFLSSEPRISLVYVIPDHPWIDSSDGADVRIAMTVAQRGKITGKLYKVIDEKSEPKDSSEASIGHPGEGIIFADMSSVVDLSIAQELRANRNLCCVGMKTIGDGFQLTRDVAGKLGYESETFAAARIHPYLNGRDLSSTSRDMFVIDLFGLTEREVVNGSPAIYQHLMDTVKPFREQNNNALFRKLWWIIGHPRQIFRNFTAGKTRFIATIETAKHQYFCFINSKIFPDSTLVTFGFDDAYYLGILSSKVHCTWSLANGGRLGVGNDPRYNKTRCFDPFPFPSPANQIEMAIRSLAEQLDAHRKARQAVYPTITLTGMYNVLSKLRTGGPLTDKDRVIHEQGLVSILKQIHDDLDAAVFDAYGWPPTLTDDEILQRLVDLNRERAEEEARGIVRWLRPEFQAPKATGAPVETQGNLLPVADDEPEPAAGATAAAKARKGPWPKSMAEQAQAIRSALAEHPGGLTPDQGARLFLRGRADRVADLLETLASLGQARVLDDGRYVRA